MKLKKFVNHFNDYTMVEIFDDVLDRRLYAGNVFNIPKNILNYKMDNYEGAVVEVKYDDNNTQYLAVAIPVVTPPDEVLETR